MKTERAEAVYETVALPLSYAGKRLIPSGPNNSRSDSPHPDHTLTAPPADGGAPSTPTPVGRKSEKGALSRSQPSLTAAFEEQRSRKHALREQKRATALRLFADPEMTNRDIAQRLGLSASVIGEWRKDGGR